MNDMRNYNTYLSQMERGNAEKMSFLSHFNGRMYDFDTIIDFGCGKGDVLKACLWTGAQLIGIDHDDYMRTVAKENVPQAMFFDELKREMITDKTLIIFNSVLHEIEDYWQTLKGIIAGTGAYVFVRDMRFQASANYTQNSFNSWLSRVVKYSNQRQLGDFIRIYGIKDLKELTHYLLKYTYVDNWELELAENYFSFDYDSLLSMGEIELEYNYFLPYKKGQIEKDFNIGNLPITTHTQIILKLNKE